MISGYPHDLGHLHLGILYEPPNILGSIPKIINQQGFSTLHGMFQDYDMTFTVEVVGCRDDYALSRALLEGERHRRWEHQAQLYCTS